MHAIDCKMNYEMRIERVSNGPVVHLDSVFVRLLRQDYVLGTVARHTVSDTFLYRTFGQKRCAKQRSNEFPE